jgi:hypothetical protein
MLRLGVQDVWQGGVMWQQLILSTAVTIARVLLPSGYPSGD